MFFMQLKISLARPTNGIGMLKWPAEADVYYATAGDVHFGSYQRELADET